MGPKHVIIKRSGVRHGESEPVIVDMETFVKIQVVLLLLNGYPFLDLSLCPVCFPYQYVGFFSLDVVA